MPGWLPILVPHIVTRLASRVVGIGNVGTAGFGAERWRAEYALRQDGERFSAVIATRYEIAPANQYLAASGRAAPFLGSRLPKNSSFSGEYVPTGQSLRCNDFERDPRVYLDICRRIGLRSLIAVPLHYDRTVVGVLMVTSPEFHAFSAMDEHIIA